MILAAGLGTRLRPLTNHLPKPLFPVLNTPLIERTALSLHEQGFHSIYINAFYLGHAIERWRQAFLARTGIDVVLEHEQELLGTGGGIANMFHAHARREEHLLVINGDVVTDIDLRRLYHVHASAVEADPDVAASLVLHRRSPWNKVGVRDGRVMAFDHPGEDALAFTGISVFSPFFLETLSCSPGSIITSLEMAMKEGLGVKAVMAEEVSTRRDGSWIWEDTGTPEGYLSAHEVLLEQMPERDCIYAEPDTVVEEGVGCKGWAVAGSGARLGKDCFLKRCVVWADTQVPPGTGCEDAIITPFGTLSSANETDRLFK